MDGIWAFMSEGPVRGIAGGTHAVVRVDDRVRQPKESGLQGELGLSANQDFHPFQLRLSQDARLYLQLGRLVALCRDGESSALQKQGSSPELFSI